MDQAGQEKKGAQDLQSDTDGRARTLKAARRVLFSRVALDTGFGQKDICAGLVRWTWVDAAQRDDMDSTHLVLLQTHENGT